MESMGMYCIHDTELNGVVKALSQYVESSADSDVGEVRDFLERLRETQEELHEKGRV